MVVDYSYASGYCPCVGQHLNRRHAFYRLHAEIITSCLPRVTPSRGVDKVPGEYTRVQRSISLSNWQMQSTFHFAWRIVVDALQL